MAAKKYCDGCGVTHTSLMCFNKPRKTVKVKKESTPSRRSIERRWLNTRKRWIKLNPPDHSGYYYCVYCGKGVKVNEMTLDHIEPRSKRPDLRFELSNLAPSCYSCNFEKGSKKPENYPMRFV